MTNHVRTRTGWNHHFAFNGFKDSDGVFGNLTRLRSKSRVERGLPAAGLIAREIHIRTCAAKHIHHRFTHFGKETVNKAGDEELNGSHGLIVFQKPTVRRCEGVWRLGVTISMNNQLFVIWDCRDPLRGSRNDVMLYGMIPPP